MRLKHEEEREQPRLDEWKVSALLFLSLSLSLSLSVGHHHLDKPSRRWPNSMPYFVSQRSVKYIWLR